MKTSTFELSVYVHGKSVREFLHEGKTFIEGRKGSEFTLRITNLTPRRALAVISVDGLSVMDGKDASFDSGGYVLNGFETLDIPGWRLDLGNVAKFVFTAPGGSYAAKMDKPKNVGVVGCAFFYERTPDYSILRCFSASHLTCDSGSGGSDLKGLDVSYSTCLNASEPSGAVACSASVQQLGTGFGEQASHNVQTVAFNKESAPAEVMEIVYDSREGLTARGVDLRPERKVYVPQAFPGAFCKPPAGWSAKR